MLRWILVRLRRLGSAGAADNARRSLDEQRLVEAHVDALVGRLAGNTLAGNPLAGGTLAGNPERRQSQPRRRVPA